MKYVILVYGSQQQRYLYARAARLAGDR